MRQQLNDTRTKAERGCKQGGFSLIEVMIALLVVAVGLMGMAQLLGIALQQNHFARFNTTAVEVARGKIEELKAGFDTGLSLGVFSSDLTAGNHGPMVITVGQPNNPELPPQALEVTWEVTDMADQQKKVTVTVRPEGVSSPETSTMVRKTIRMTGLFAP